MFYKKVDYSKACFGINADVASKKTPDSGYYVSRVKLWLDRTIKEDLPPLPPNMTLVQVIAGYLKQIGLEIREQIPKRHPKCNEPSRYKYCLAVPTMWSEQSKDIMRNAAVLAGLIEKYDGPKKLSIIDETVAAALYAERVSPELKLAHGSLYMICDAGGGTVDLAVFEKDDSPGKNGLKEVTMGTGHSCGSSFLDTRFEALLRERTCRHPEYSEMDLLNIMWKFKYELKPYLYVDDDERSGHIKKINDIYIRKHPNPSKAKKFTVAEIFTKVFEPVVNKVLAMIEIQLTQLRGRVLDVMFITGGFGSSPYLLARIKDICGSRVKNIKVVKNGNRAVMEGMILFEKESRIITRRILRRTYGIKLCSPTDELDDNNKTSTQDKFHVYIRKGYPVNDKVWTTRNLTWKKDSLPIISLYAYDGDEPVPEYPTTEDIDLVAIFDTQFPIAENKTTTHQLMAMEMRFDIDKIDVKVNIAGREFKYFTAWDVIEKKQTLAYTELISPAGKMRKWWRIDGAVNCLP
ncbi:hypothetical protein F4703DRAFT_1916146 [Phycomyces blakesleeanus]